RLEGLTLRFPVINVAESWAKLTYEAPLIGRSVGQAIEEKLAKLEEQGLRPGREVVFFGYGTVAQATAAYLQQRGARPAAYNPALDAELAGRGRELKLAAGKRGVRVLSRAEALRSGRIVVGASGETSIDAHDLDALPDGALLFNAASGVDEFKVPA